MSFDIFLACPPGLEPILLEETQSLGLGGTVTPGGVTIQGSWPEVWRANLELRGASRVLARIGGFRVMHLAQLDKRATRFDWSLFRPDLPIKVEVTCRKSRVYHAGAAAQRIEGALQSAGLTIGPDGLTLRARIEDDFCTFSIDTSGALLHKRGHKEAVNKAPMRETLAALFLRSCAYDGREALVDPMCGSGTFPIEAAEIALGLLPGRSRRFAFEDLTSFDARAVSELRDRPADGQPAHVFGFDRDQGAIRMAQENAQRSGVTATFACQPVSALSPPCEAPGLVMVNPPYGTRIGNKHMLHGLYAALGARLTETFSGWRVGLVTSDRGLAKSTGLNFRDVSPPIPHGGLRIHLFQANLP